MNVERTGGIAALVCAATYVVGFALLATLLAPSGYADANADPAEVVAFVVANPGLMTMWNLAIYVVNAIALAVLAVALRARFAPTHPELARTVLVFGLLWATLVLGAGMIANMAVEQTARVFPADPAEAIRLWQTLHLVELGLGGGNEIAGGVWALVVSAAGWLTGRLSRPLCVLGFVVGASGLPTVIAPLGDVFGTVFGLGYIVWFAWTGVVLLRR